MKEKEKADKGITKIDLTESSSKDDRQDNSSSWKKDEKKDKDGESTVANHVSDHNHESNEGSKKKGETPQKLPADPHPLDFTRVCNQKFCFLLDDEKNDAKGMSKPESVDKNADDKRNDRRKNDRRNKSDPRNWTRYSMYGGSTRSYGGSREPRVRRTNRGGVPKSSRRDSKYSESDYSDEVSGSGREDKSSRMDREKPR